jgi:cysteine desulfuration protein SufE
MKVKERFEGSPSDEVKYDIIINMGKGQQTMSSALMTENNLVKGCQSTMYLHSRYEDGAVHFQAFSDALISSGLAQMMIEVYSGEDPETILKCPPTFIEELNIPASLTPNRANGLYNIHLRMKQDALNYLITKGGHP